MEKIKSYLLKYKSFIAYGVVGVLATALNFLLYYLFARLLNMHYLLAVAVAFVLATLFAFWGNKYFIFCSKTEGFKAFFTSCSNLWF